MGSIKADSILPTNNGNNLILRTGVEDVERVRISPSGDITVNGSFSTSVTGNINVVGNVGVTGNMNFVGGATFSGKITTASTTDSDSSVTLTTKGYLNGFAPKLFCTINASGTVVTQKTITGETITCSKGGAGVFNITVPSGIFADANYTVLTTISSDGRTGLFCPVVTARTATTLTVRCITSSAGVEDPTLINVAIFDI